MENEKDDIPRNDQDNSVDSSEEDSKNKNKVVAKDLVDLKHVATKKQQISQETQALADAIKEKGLEEDLTGELSNDEITILESFIGKRLFLRRIAIVVNQSRMPLGIEPLKKEELEKLLDRLIHKELIDFDIINDERVYYLTEKGKETLQ